MERDRPQPPADPVVDLSDRSGVGPLWATATTDLNATLLAWEAGHSTPEHVNDERDVLIVVLAGSGLVILDGRERAVASAHVIVIEKGRSRRVVAGPEGIRYLSVHLRRPGLRIRTAAERAPA